MIGKAFTWKAVTALTAGDGKAIPKGDDKWEKGANMFIRHKEH